MGTDNNGLETKVLIVLTKEDAAEMEKLLNEGFVQLRLDRFGEGVIATLAKVVKLNGITKPGENGIAIDLSKLK